jgi:hypothetical protein
MIRPLGKLDKDPLEVVIILEPIIVATLSYSFLSFIILLRAFDGQHANQQVNFYKVGKGG